MASSASQLNHEETFANACEAGSRILALGTSLGERFRLVEEYAATALPSEAQGEASSPLLLSEVPRFRRPAPPLLRGDPVAGVLAPLDSAPESRGPRGP